MRPTVVSSAHFVMVLEKCKGGQSCMKRAGLNAPLWYACKTAGNVFNVGYYHFLKTLHYYCCEGDWAVVIEGGDR